MATQWPDRGALAADVAALAGLERGSATAGEHRAAGIVAARLARAGAEDVRVERFRYARSWSLRQAPHVAAGLAAAALGGRRGAALALATLVSFDADFSGRSQRLGRLLPAGEGANAVARVPGRGRRRRTLVLVAHTDAARTGLMWRVLARVPARRSGVLAFSAVPELALAAVVAGRRRTPAVALAVTLALMLDAGRGRPVPGANDNASGVAAMVALAERFAREPLPGCDVVLLACGCEESGMGGMGAWLGAAGAELERSQTLVLGLDTIGCGEPALVAREGALRAVSDPERDLALAERAARAAGLEQPRRYRIGGWTDPVIAVLAGFRAISLVSLSGNRFSNYHLPTDTPENVDWRSVSACARLAAETAELWAEGAS